MAGERILIVDDEENARTALAELLREEGYRVETAADGVKALPKLAALAPDVLVTDLRMPGLGGLELMAKARERDPECAVIVMTAFADAGALAQASNLGAADCLMKPVNVEELMRVVERELERKRRRAGSR
jgi:DNA-binding NtrC family response regulator